MYLDALKPACGRDTRGWFARLNAQLSDMCRMLYEWDGTVCCMASDNLDHEGRARSDKIGCWNLRNPCGNRDMDVVDVDEDGVGMMISDDVPGAWESEVTLGRTQLRYT